MFERGQIYRRRELHDQYGGQRQGGISTPKSHDIIMLFTGESGQQYGYSDGWNEDSSVFLYTGEGQSGDMELMRGNAAIRDHLASDKELHLFRYVRTGYVEYVDQMRCTSFHYVKASDIDGHARQAVVFELVPINQ